MAQVLSEQISAVRKQRRPNIAKEIEKNIVTFGGGELEIMRLSFIQMTGSDGLAGGLKTNKLRCDTL